MNIYDDIKMKINELYEKINPNDLSWLEDARKTFSLFIKFEKLKDFAKALECVIENLEKDGKQAQKLPSVRVLLEDLRRSEPDFLIENLRRVGYAIAQNNKSMKEAINKEALRILEQVRLGKRDAVVGMLIRNFAIHNIQMPPELVEALKPKYNINLFRAFVYAFLSGFIPKEENERRKDERE